MVAVAAKGGVGRVDEVASVRVHHHLHQVSSVFGVQLPHPLHQAGWDLLVVTSHDGKVGN